MNPSTHLTPAAAVTCHKNSFNVKNSYNTTYNTKYVDESAQILEWLSPLEPRLRHHDVRTRRLDGLGHWLLETEDFIKWRDGGNGFSTATLFGSGAPGTGKTYLM